MKVGVLYYYRVGGSGNIAYELSKKLSMLYGVEIHFIGIQRPYRYVEGVDENIGLHFHEIHVQDYPVFDYTPYTIILASKLSRLIDELDLDIVHSHYALPHAISANLARDMSCKKVKTIVTLHGTDITIVGKRPDMKNITRFSILQSDGVTSVSSFLKNRTVSDFCVDPSKIEMIHNFIELDGFDEIEKHTEQEDKSINIIHISTFREIKKPMDVLYIFEKMVRMNVIKNMQLQLVGDGPLLEYMKEWVKEKKLLDKINFLGKKLNTDDYLKKSDLLLLTSETESFGLVLLEAMKFGVPVLACGSAGVNEVIDDDRTGLLYKKGHLDEAVMKGIALLKNNDKKKVIISNAYKKLFKSFNINDKAKEYYDLYERVLKQ